MILSLSLSLTLIYIYIYIYWCLAYVCINSLLKVLCFALPSLKQMVIASSSIGEGAEL